jgi:hypothetical protein
MQKLIAFALTFGFLTLSHSAQAQHTFAERAACQQDAFRMCTHAMPDRDRVRSCLRQNMRRISSLCRGALQRSRL